MARRVNTKFLVIFSVIVLGGVAAGFVLQGPLKNIWRGNRSEKQIAAGDKLVEQATKTTNALERKSLLEEAAKNYAMAAGVESKNPELYVKLGDVYSRLAPFDLGYINQSYAMWDKALEADPRYVPALRRLMDSYYKQATDRTAIAAIYTRLEQRANTLKAVDPKDVRAAAIASIVPIKQWLNGIETQMVFINASIEELTKLVNDNPASPETPDMVFHMAMAKARKGLDLKKLAQEKDGNILIGESVKAFQDAVKRDPKNASLHYKFFQLLMQLRRSDSAERDQTQNYTQMLKIELDKARNLLSEEDENYVEVNLASYTVAKALIRDPKDHTAEDILLKLYKVRPYDQRVRLQVANMWHTPEKRDLAIDLLEQPMVDPGWAGVEAFMKADLEFKSWAELCNLYIDRYYTKSGDERPAELKKIEDNYGKLYAKARESWEVLKIRGRIELLKGGPTANVDAIQTFEKAQSRFMVTNPNNAEDSDITWELAKAYLRIHEFGSAKTQLLKLKARNPDFIPMRMKLAEVLIHEGDNAGARVEAEYLVSQAPDLPEVLKLLLAVLDANKDAIQVKATFAKLPEAKRDEQLIKAQIANMPPVSNPDESVRLYKVVLANDPADFDALQGVREALSPAKRGEEMDPVKKAELLKLLEIAHAAKPDDKRIGFLIDTLNSPEKQFGIAEELVRTQYKDDPYTMEIKLYELNLAAMTGKAGAPSKQDAFEHLQKAFRLKPEEVQVLELMFQYYLSEANWDKAGEIVDKLTAKNADNVGGRIFKFRLAMAKGDLAGAIKVARELTADWKDFARSWVFLGQALQADKKFEDAISAYDMALEKQSDNIEALAGNIVCCFQRNRPNDALRYIERGRAAHPGNAYFKNQWTMFHLSQYGDAAKVIQPALEERDANPKDMAKWIALGRAQYSAAQKRDKDSAKYVADAKATFTKAQEQWPKEMVIWAFLSEIADFNGDPAAGEALLKDMVGRKDFDMAPEPALMLADHYLRHNLPAKAEEVFKQTLEKFKDLKDVRVPIEIRRRLAAFYTQSRRWDEAIKTLEPASADQLIKQQMVEVYLLQASVENNDPKLLGKAETLVRGMLETNGEDAQLHALLGLVMMDTKKEQQASEQFDVALKLDPRNQAALFRRGQLRLRQKQLDGAIADLSLLRDVNPNYVDCRLVLAEALRQQRLPTGGLRLEEAAKELEYALIRAPYRHDIRVSLAGIYADMKPTPYWDQVDRVITDGEKVEPNDVSWKRMLGKLWSQRGMHEKAVLKIRDALVIGLGREKDPNLTPAQVEAVKRENSDMVRDYLTILENGGNAHNDDSPKYWGQLEQETQRIFADKTIADTGWWFYLKRGAARRNLGNAGQALEDFTKAMQIVEADKMPNQENMNLIIDSLDRTMGTQSAIDMVKSLFDRSKDKDAAAATRWRIVLARLYFNKKDFESATKEIEQARGESANLDANQQLGVLNIAGNVYMMAGDYPKARAAFEQLLVKQPNDIGALNNLAFIMAEHVKPADINKGLEYSQKAYDVMKKLNMNDPNVLDTVGWINVLAYEAKMGDDKLVTGVDYLKKSLDAGEIAEAQYHYGVALMKQKYPQYAKDSFTRADELLNKQEKKENKPVDPELRKRVTEALTEVDKALNPGGGVKQ